MCIWLVAVQWCSNPIHGPRSVSLASLERCRDTRGHGVLRRLLCERCHLLRKRRRHITMSYRWSWRQRRHWSATMPDHQTPSFLYTNAAI